ncbi:ORC1-type DNA replication protein [Candidatus Burarchaeum australiense]|nr:ORC1-type DNA replication protein [Candidatus Burarchaeum australiense]
MPNSNLFAKGRAESRIFRDERVLLPEYLPDVLPHRDREISGLVAALQGAAEGEGSENVLLTGPPGTGKTSTARYVLRELQDYSSRVVTLYVNCWEVGTRHGVLTRLANALELVTPRRGVATDEIMERLAEALGKSGKAIVIVLDEVDRLFAAKYEEWRVLYDLSRGNELFSARIGLISITNNEDITAGMDVRVKSSLVQRHVKFSRYSPVELKDILRERAKLAFLPDALHPEVMPLCAAMAAKRGGDARIALNILWRAGKLAERENAGQVSIEHARRVRDEVASEQPTREEIEPRLEGFEKKIYELVKEKGEMTSGELYRLLDASERTAGEHVSRLEKLGVLETRLLETKEETGGVRGKTRLIFIKGKGK